jgi:hypothetical protein
VGEAAEGADPWTSSPVPAGESSGRGLLVGVLAVFLGVTAVLTAVAAYCAGTGGSGVPQPVGVPGWLAGWCQGDGSWYVRIAESGYFYIPGRQSSVAFFPVFPMLLRGFGAVVGDVRIGGWLLGVLAGGVSVLLFACWVRTRLPRPAALTAVAVLVVYPYSFFLHGAVYSDGLFLVTAIGAFLLLERRMYWLAGLVGAFATAGRPVGLAVAVGLAVRVLEIRAEARNPGMPRPCASGSTERGRSATGEPPGGADPRSPRRPGVRELLCAVRGIGWRQAGVLCSVVGLAGWCGYLWLRFGDPLAFLTVQAAPGWDQGSGPATWFKVPYLLAVAHRVPVRLLTAQALAGLGAVLILGRVWRRFGWGYTVYSVIVLVIPIVGTKDFMGLGRYVLAAFPVFAAAGDALAGSRHRWHRTAVLGLSAVLLLVATALFAQGVEVS